MTQTNLSMQPGKIVQIPLFLLTGSTGEVRVQDGFPETTISVSDPSVAVFDPVELDSAPGVKITALREGVCDVRVESGGLATFRVTVEQERQGLRWQPDLAAATELPFDPNGEATEQGLTLRYSGLPANSGVLTASGSVNGAIQGVLAIKQDSVGEDSTQFETFGIPQGATLEQVAQIVSDALASMNFVLSQPSGVAANFNLQGAGVIEIGAVAMEPAPGGGTIPPDPFPPGSVDGPNSSPHGDDYWLQRDTNDVWFIWWNVDTDPGPDVKKQLPVFLADENVDQAYRDDVLSRAEELGYGS